MEIIKLTSMARIILFILTLSISACTTTKKTSSTVDTATIPLQDLNLVKSKIPKVLIEAKKTPYEVPADQSCKALNQLVLSLNEVLPADVDATAAEKQKSKSKTAKALNNAVKGAIPFRGWLRKLSGAERHSKKVAAAIFAGTVRRAFIKGIKATKECEESV